MNVPIFPSDELQSVIVLCMYANVFEKWTWKRIILSNDSHSTHRMTNLKSQAASTVAASLPHAQTNKSKPNHQLTKIYVVISFNALSLYAYIYLSVAFDQHLGFTKWKITGSICHFILRLLLFFSSFLTFSFEF